MQATRTDPEFGGAGVLRCCSHQCLIDDVDRRSARSTQCGQAVSQQYLVIKSANLLVISVLIRRGSKFKFELLLKESLALRVPGS
jgi:hypothetical protein